MSSARQHSQLMANKGSQRQQQQQRDAIRGSAQLPAQDASEATNMHRQISDWLKIKPESHTSSAAGGFVTTITWRIPETERRLPVGGLLLKSELSARGFGRNKKAAEAAACLDLLVAIGAAEEMPNHQRHEAAAIRDLVNAAGHSIKQVIERASRLMRQSSPACWQLFLPEVYGAAITEGCSLIIDELLTLMEELVKANAYRLPVRLWDALLLLPLIFDSCLVVVW
eukprot:GHVU01221776.1.p1 GENE.GHVU01221776.1~~GHVU01221776.1.p1  ORF type:complete len:260 (+),score=62.43 GHVU01221776.1:105-782(+)